MSTLSMARRKNELAPNQRLAQAIVDQYQPKSVEDMQDALKDIFGLMFEAMLKGEMNSHLGYCNNERGEKDTPNRRNGYSKKNIKNNCGGCYN
jgi:transposase, mutator family